MKPEAPELSQAALRLFASLVETRSLSASARRLRIVPSAASQQLARLETQLGRSLFHRRKAGLVPTPEGLELAARILPLWEQLQGEIRQLYVPEGGVQAETLRLGSLREFAELQLAELIAKLGRAHGNLRVELRLGGGRDLFEAMKRGEVDGVFTLAGPERENVRSYRVRKQRALVLAHADSKAADTKSMDYVAYQSEDPLVGAWLRRRAKGGYRDFRPRFLCPSHAQLVEFLVANPGCVGVLPEFSGPVIEALQRGRLRIVETLPLPIDIFFHRLESAWTPPRIAVLEKSVREHFRAPPAR